MARAIVCDIGEMKINIYLQCVSIEKIKALMKKFNQSKNTIPMIALKHMMAIG